MPNPLLDFLIVPLIIYVVERDEMTEYRKLFGTGMIVAIANYGLWVLVAPSLGALLTIPILVVVDALVLRLFFGLTLRQTAMAVGILLAYHIACLAFIGVAAPPRVPLLPGSAEAPRRSCPGLAAQPTARGTPTTILSVWPLTPYPSRASR